MLRRYARSRSLNPRMRTLCEPSVRATTVRDFIRSHGGEAYSAPRDSSICRCSHSWCSCRKTLLNIEGLGRQLYPALNLWDTAKPFLEQWVAERYSLQTVSKRLQEDAPALLESLPLLPDLVLARLRQPQSSEPQPCVAPAWVLPLTGLGALALGFGIAQSIEGQGWLILGCGCLLLRDRFPYTDNATADLWHTTHMTTFDAQTPTPMTPRWNEQGLIPAVTQDHATGEVLMVAWMNAEALALTLSQRQAMCIGHDPDRRSGARERPLATLRNSSTSH